MEDIFLMAAGVLWIIMVNWYRNKWIQSKQETEESIKKNLSLRIREKILYHENRELKASIQLLEYTVKIRTETSGQQREEIRLLKQKIENLKSLSTDLNKIITDGKSQSIH